MKPQAELKVEWVPIESIVPYERNAKLHPQSQIDSIAASIEEFNNCDPLGVWTDKDGRTVVVEGHGRLLALKKLGIETAPVIYLDHLTDEQRRAYTHVHNQTTLNSGFDVEILDRELAELDFEWDDFGFEDVAEVVEDGLSDDYSQNVGTVTYEPKDSSWSAEDLYEMDEGRFDGVLDAIDDEGIKEMLKLRMAWFCEFDFAKIADYYAYQATPDEQRAFEAMGLVLLDRDQLIENGFASLVESIGGGLSEPKTIDRAWRREEALQHGVHHQQGKA